MKNTIILKKNYEFKKVLTNGKYMRGKQIEVFFLKENIPFNLLGIAIGKKIGNSVYRNKIKRLIRENYRLLESNINLGNCFVILWNKKVDKKEANFYVIQEDLKYIFEKLNIVKEN